MSDKIELGLIVSLQDNIGEGFRKVADLGIPTCQVSCAGEDLVTNEKLDELADAMAASPVRVSSIFVVFKGQTYNRETGPQTDGLVPLEHRQRRLELMLKCADITRDLGVDTMTSHIGFIPNDEQDDLYVTFLDAMKQVTGHMGKNDQIFCFETGQELPSTLKRAIDHIGADNLFVNLDPGNLILYGMADPLDAVSILGPWVRGMHAKDAVWPNRDEKLGKEMRLGDGKVDFRLLLRRLKACGFEGPVTIEREIRGPQQVEDIKHAMAFLDPLL